MPVLNVLSVTLDVPDIEPGIDFYTQAGLIAHRQNRNVDFSCPDQAPHCLSLRGGAAQKRLHHVSLLVDDLASIEKSVRTSQGSIVPPPEGGSATGLWARDPHGILFHLTEGLAPPGVAATPPFEVNGPGYIPRKGRSAILPKVAYAPARPLKLGHVLLFTPDVDASVQFVVDALGMALADRSKDIIAFCCTRKNSEHHVLAFAKSSAVGFHHASFQVADPDSVGRAGRSLASAARGDWGFGRHTIGSNFFHYIQDPWGSWFEYYADMDFIEDIEAWTPTDYDLEDSLASWAPAVPDDFVHNYEATQTQ